MGTQIAQCAAACQLVDVSPGNRQGLVQQLILIVGAGEAHDLAQCAGLNQLTNVSVCRVLGVVEANVVYNALLSCQLSQFLGLLSGDGQRLLAVYVLAVFQSCLSNLVVESVRGSDVNQINVRIGYNIMPVGGDALEADLLLCGLCSFLVCVSNDLEGCNAVVRAKQHLSVSQCRGMSLAHPARTYQTNTDFFHFLFLLKNVLSMVIHEFTNFFTAFESLKIREKRFVSLVFVRVSRLTVPIVYGENREMSLHRIFLFYT